MGRLWTTAPLKGLYLGVHVTRVQEMLQVKGREFRIQGLEFRVRWCRIEG